MSEQAELERLAELLPRLAMAVVFQCMRSPDGIAVDKPHLRHVWLIAKSVERIHETNGYWTPESTSALIDMRTAMLEALRLIHGLDRGVPPDIDHVDRLGGEWMLQRDPGESDGDFERRKRLLESGGGIVSSDDLATQYQQAILIDFYGPAERLQRLLGLSDAAEATLFDALKEDPGVTEILRPAHRRARALLQLVEERHGDAPGDEALAAAFAAVRKSLAEMEAWSR